MKAGRPSRLLAQLEDKPAVVKVCHTIDKALYKEVKTYAIEHEITISELVQKALKLVIQKSI